MTRYRRLVDLMLGGRTRVDAEMDLEIESHIAMRAADLERAGMTPAAARVEAERRFGEFESARKRLREAARHRDSAVRQRDWLGSIVADLRYAARQARRAPGFTALTIGTLALGIGATTAVFTLVERVLIRPLPYAHAERLMALGSLDSARNRIEVVSARDWLDWRHARSLETSALYSLPFRQTIFTTDSATRASAYRVTGDFFRVLQGRFVVGRSFTSDEVANRAPVVVISDRLWRTVFSGDPTLARPLRTANRTYTVVGVVAPGQEFPAQTDIWFPIEFTAQGEGARVNVSWSMIARLKPDATLDQAAAELTTIARGILASDPTALYDHGVTAGALGKSIVGDVSTYLQLLMATVGFVLLIVCANVAASGLARATTRAREMAIRSSLGAVRARLAQQLLLEHVGLALVGGVLGLAFAWAAVRGILARWGGQIPRAAEISMDAGVFLFALVASLVAGALAGIIPALRVTRVSTRGLLASHGRGTARGGRNLAGAGLVSLEIALAVLLLTGAGLLVRSFRAVIGRDIGFDTNVATAEVTLSGPTYNQDSVRRFMYWDQLIDSFRGIPGVQAVGAANWIPLGITGQSFVEIEGNNTQGAGAVYRTVSHGFFSALKMPTVAGRTFDAQDGFSTQRVAVVNRMMAEKYWPGQSPIGRLVRATSQESGPRGEPAPWLTVIGVVGDVRTYGLETEPRAELYVYFRQTPRWTTTMTALVRASVPAGQILPEMRRRAHAVDARVAIDAGTLDTRLANTLATRTLAMSLLTAFAGAALVLAALGIYGVLSYGVAQRTRELAVRAALGAQRGELLWLVLVAGLRVVAVGVAGGVVAAFLLTRGLESMLVDITPGDPLSYVLAIVLLLAACLAAILIPSVRATRLDPLIALQGE